MDKITELNKLELEMTEDKSLPLLESNLVFGEGNSNCQVIFIGEAPGFNEDREGRPFVGRAGQLLRKFIRDLGWQERDVYITNILKRRPPENRDPNPEEIESYKPYLARQIDIINPKIIVPLGRFAMNYFLPAAKITRDQGKLFSTGKYFILPMLHPAAALRGNEAMKMFEESFQKLPAALDKVNKGEFEEVKQVEYSQKQKKFEDVQKKLF
ncbi:MAG: DNA polymerase bacteriophage-type [Parcubacteria group bacterium Gr01-1014_24]|nr:MAG: DNA polymerase bacteriophage-type [Parcubacteria group bacterium Gr01-1014_24]